MDRKVRILFFWLFQLSLSISFGQTPVKVSAKIKSIPNSLQFFAIGDWGRKGQAHASQNSVKNQESLAVTMQQVGEIMSPEFIISTGDNFYTTGVKSTSDPRWKETFEDVYKGGWMLRPWYVVLGNHDHGGSVQAEIDYTRYDKNKRWHLPSNYYSEIIMLPDSGTAQFIFIDTTPLVKGEDPVQLAWLAKELSVQNDRAEGSRLYDWRFVVGHHPLYSGNWRTGEQTRLQDDLEKLLIDNNIDVYLSGHDHNLQYLKKDKINYFISGAGSQIYESAWLQGVTQYLYCKEGVICTSAFIAFSLERSAMTVQMIDSRGELLYQKRIEK